MSDQQFTGVSVRDFQWTMTPHYFFDEVLPKEDYCTIKVVAHVIRKTLGWSAPKSEGEGRKRRRHYGISLSQFMADMSMSKPSALKGIKRALEMNYIAVLDAHTRTDAQSYTLPWIDEHPEIANSFAGSSDLTWTPTPNWYYDLLLPTESEAVAKVVGAFIRRTWAYADPKTMRPKMRMPMSHDEIATASGLSLRSVKTAMPLCMRDDASYVRCVLAPRNQHAGGMYELNIKRTSEHESIHAECAGAKIPTPESSAGANFLPPSAEECRCKDLTTSTGAGANFLPPSESAGAKILPLLKEDTLCFPTTLGLSGKKGEKEKAFDGVSPSIVGCVPQPNYPGHSEPESKTETSVRKPKRSSSKKTLPEAVKGDIDILRDKLSQLAEPRRYHLSGKVWGMWVIAWKRLLKSNGGTYTAFELDGALCSWAEAGYPLDAPFWFEQQVNHAVRHTLTLYDQYKARQKRAGTPEKTAVQRAIERGEPVRVIPQAIEEYFVPADQIVHVEI